MGKNNERKSWKEFVVNFALVYSLIIGTIFVSYSIVRGLFPLYYHLIPLIIFIVYSIWWVADKLNKKWLFNESESRTKGTHPV